MLSVVDDGGSVEVAVPGWHTLMHRLKRTVQAAAATEAADDRASDDVSPRNGVSEGDYSDGASIVAAANSILEQLLLWGQTAKAEQDAWHGSPPKGTCHRTSPLVSVDVRRCAAALSPTCGRVTTESPSGTCL